MATAGDAHSKIIACLAITVLDGVSPHDSIRVGDDLAPRDPGPAIENYHLVELLSFAFVHVEDNYAALRTSPCGEMGLHECPPNDL
jgi:hypothetical protein